MCRHIVYSRRPASTMQHMYIQATYGNICTYRQHMSTIYIVYSRRPASTRKSDHAAARHEMRATRALPLQRRKKGEKKSEQRCCEKKKKMRTACPLGHWKPIIKETRISAAAACHEKRDTRYISVFALCVCVCVCVYTRT